MLAEPSEISWYPGGTAIADVIEAVDMCRNCRIALFEVNWIDDKMVAFENYIEWEKQS